MITFKHSWMLALVAMGSCGRSPLQGGGVNLPGTDAGLPPCERGLTQCGTRNVSLCYDLRRSQNHCGACGHACAPGISCQEGACQQVSCKGPLSFRALGEVAYGSLEVSPSYRPALGDFNGDGILDLAGTAAIIEPDGILAGAHVLSGTNLLYGAGDGTFPTVRRIESTRIENWRYFAIDLDSNGVLDLVSIRQNSRAVTVRRGSGNRDAPFVESVDYPTSDIPDSVLLADLNSDGHPELVAGVGQNLEIWRGQGTGRFEHESTLPARGLSPSLLGVDWNRDGALDLVYGSPNLHLRYGRGDGTFDPEISCGLALAGPAYGSPYGPSPGPSSIAADLDHDNVIDLVGYANVFLSLDGCIPSKILPATGWARAFSDTPLDVVDLNGDGNLDLLAPPDVYLGDGKGAFDPFVWPPLLGTATDLFLVGDLNRDGKLDLIAAGFQGWQVFLNTCQ